MIPAKCQNVSLLGCSKEITNGGEGGESHLVTPKVPTWLLFQYPSSCVACFWMSSEQCIQCLLWYLYFFHIWIIPFACSWQKHILSYKEVMDTLGPPLSSTPVISLAMHWWFSRQWKQMIQLFFGWRISWCYTDADP